MAIVVAANEEGRKFYEKAEVKPAKWLLPDGSITDKFPMSGGSDVKLQNNKEVSITENGEIEITPDEGYDGMKKITATVNVSGGGSDDLQLYYWEKAGDSDSGFWTAFAIAPVVEAGEALSPQQDMRFSAPDNVVAESLTRNVIYSRVSDTSFSLADRSSTITYVRYSEYDTTLSALVASTI